VADDPELDELKRKRAENRAKRAEEAKKAEQGESSRKSLRALVEERWPTAYNKFAHALQSINEKMADELLEIEHTRRDASRPDVVGELFITVRDTGDPVGDSLNLQFLADNSILAIFNPYSRLGVAQWNENLTVIDAGADAYERLLKNLLARVIAAQTKA
jgi:hypothetical protein